MPGSEGPLALDSALAAYLSCVELCEAAYKRSVLPLFPLAKH
jgi:hypothetical protein